MRVPISQVKRIPIKSSTPSEPHATSVYVNDAERVRDERLLSKLVEQIEKEQRQRGTVNSSEVNNDSLRALSADVENDSLELERLLPRNAVVQLVYELTKQIESLVQLQLQFQRSLIEMQEEIRRMREKIARESDVKEAESRRMQPEIDEIGTVSMDTSPPPPVSNEDNSLDGRDEGFPLQRIPKQAKGSKVRAKNSSRQYVRQNSTLHSCEECGKGFNRKDHLVRHLRIHTDSTLHSCEECGKGFNRKDHLVRHLRIHTGAKPFKCQICKATFREKSGLSRHLLTHTNEKPYTCDICQGGFKRKSHISEHMLIHSGLKPWKCNLCQKDFRKKSTLTKHQKLHVNDKE